MLKLIVIVRYFTLTIQNLQRWLPLLTKQNITEIVWSVMFGLFKSKKQKLVDKYNKLLKQSYELSNVSRKDSDEKLAEANEVLKEIEAID